MLDANSDGGGRLVLSSFDYEVSARVEVAADIAEPGVALVSGRLLADISRSLPARPVEVTTDGAKVVVTCGSSRFTLLTLPVEDYPALPEMPGASGSLRGDVFAAPWRRSRWPLAATTPSPCSPACGSRSRPRRSPWRPPTATGSRCATWRGPRSRPGCRPSRWCRPARCRTPR